MSFVNITNVCVKDNPALFTAPLSLTVTFECLRDIPEELEWKLIYVGSSEDASYDQILESFSMGPLNMGMMEFDLEAEAPDPNKIPTNELLGATALILTTSYKGAEFFRIGYYVYNNYTDPELIENTPEKVILEKVYRNILADKPRITRFEIEWEKKPETPTIQVDDENSLSNYLRESLSLKDAAILSGQSLVSGNGFAQEKLAVNLDNPFLEEATDTSSVN